VYPGPVWAGAELGLGACKGIINVLISVFALDYMFPTLIFSHVCVAGPVIGRSTKIIKRMLEAFPMGKFSIGCSRVDLIFRYFVTRGSFAVHVHFWCYSV